MSQEQSYANCPSCPDIKKKIDRIELALLGPDGTGREAGLVKAVNKIESSLNVQSSWANMFKPVAIAVVSSALTFALTYGVFHIV